MRMTTAIRTSTTTAQHPSQLGGPEVLLHWPARVAVRAMKGPRRQLEPRVPLEQLRQSRTLLALLRHPAMEPVRWRGQAVRSGEDWNPGEATVPFPARPRQFALLPPPSPLFNLWRRTAMGTQHRPRIKIRRNPSNSANHSRDLHLLPRSLTTWLWLLRGTLPPTPLLRRTIC